MESTDGVVDGAVDDGIQHDPQSPAIEAQRQTSGVAVVAMAPLQKAVVPDPRWPFLGRWSSPITVTPPALATRIASTAPSVDANPPPPSTVVSPAPSLPTVAIAAPQGPDSHDELNEAGEGTIPPGNATGNVSETDDSDSEPGKDTGFVQSLGAWAKPLHFTPPPTPSEPSTPMLFVSEEVKNQMVSFWPSLGESVANGQKKKKGKFASTQETPLVPVKKFPPPALKDDGSIRFPWAARMNQSTRNLFRAAEPTYRLDGTPQVTIPSSVLKLGPENNEEYIIGQFHRCSSPPGGLIHAVLNRLWGRECKISCKKLGEASYLFHIPHENTRKWVIHRGVWHVDDCLLFVAPWSPVNSLKTPEISTLPVWVTLKNIPDSCFSRLGISHIASGLGEPMLTHRPRLDPTVMGEAKILVEVELDKPFPKLIALDDKQGNIFLVAAEYAWIPSACGRCGALGHKEKRCLLPPKPLEAHTDVQAPKETQVINEEIPVVDIVPVMHNSVALANSSTSLLKGTPFTPATNLEENHISPVAFQEPVTQKKPTPISPAEEASNERSTNLNEVHSFHRSMSDNALLSLAASVAASTPSQIMEETPSLVHFTKASNSLEKEQSYGEDLNEDSPHSQKFYQINPEINLGGGNDKGQFLVGETSGYNLTRGGRSIKPTQKIQEMEWTTIRGKGKRGRRGRGNHYR